MKTGQDIFINIPDAYIQKIFQTAWWDILTQHISEEKYHQKSNREQNKFKQMVSCKKCDSWIYLCISKDLLFYMVVYWFLTNLKQDFSYILATTFQDFN